MTSAASAATPAAFAGRLHRRSAAASGLARTALAFALMLLTAHQAAAQATAAPVPSSSSSSTTPAVDGAASSTPAAVTAPTPTPATATTTATTTATATTNPTPTPTPAPAPAPGGKVDASVWRSLSNSLAQTMADTLARPAAAGSSRTAGPITSMAQSAADFLRNVGTGKNLQQGNVLGGRLMGQQAGGGGAGLGSGLGSGGMIRRVTDGELMSAFAELRDTAQGLGLVLPASSRATLSTWSQLADAMQNARGAGADMASSALPALAGAMRIGGAANLAQAGAAGRATSPWNWPGMAGAALATLGNLGIDAFLNGPGAILALTSLGLGLAASILGIVGGSLFIGGASVLLGAGVDGLKSSEAKKNGNSTVNVDQFDKLARSAQEDVLVNALSPSIIQWVDFASGVLDATDFVTNGKIDGAGA
ncbi:hypothetical protein HYH02_004352 [Chlamydomonas schloesseri]|uniref:Uncharacterized protein n=1 Tax=Chlamydomonas schloesseri TaxID=2026947 RepID=A0A835WPN0_9CHLO|nr:hypothetical protein HYH02_004352 [Chlamydomonas schloesseri]|eukprot:KAG2451084.1 hypothetical protein HYH02_004352 [Chlamydomonas schloesseri]